MRIAQRHKQGNQYYRIHEKLVRYNGNAKYCSNKACNYKNPKRYEWALIKGREYSLDINDYIPLCPSCHRKYDFKPESGIKAGLKQRGKIAEYRMRIIMQITADDHLLYLSVDKASEATMVSRTAISNCLSGLSKQAGGYKWRYRE
jgi:hypothetical protein